MRREYLISDYRGDLCSDIIGRTWTASITQGTTNYITIFRSTMTLGAGQVKDSASATIITRTWYTLKVDRIQRSIE